ncbi:porin [Actibacterium sp. MT2.3-13A]|uniref:porin n=1 Tax=Actibacterium sp. MT2.3-13A TaxID=2828332 RepID=UPI001BA71257|nr:porin [Actibacterium sp. MT2.3-13A]
MKKVLFATTALVASAGFAAAEIEFSGGAEMGLVGGDAYVSEDLAFHNDIWLHVNFSGETDNGLTFGAHMEFDETNGGKAINGGWAGDNESVFISGAFGTLTLGEIDGAYDRAMQEVALVGGSIADDETAHGGFNGNSGLDGIYDNQILRYDYSFGDFSFHASLEMDDAAVAPGDDNWGLGFQYDADLGGASVGFGLGYQTNDAIDVFGVSVDADFGNGFEAAVNYSQMDPAGAANNIDHIGVGVGYTMDALSIGLNYGEYDLPTVGGVNLDTSGFGLAVNYDLGGGAVVQFGYGSTDNPAGVVDVESYSLGIAMSF